MLGVQPGGCGRKKHLLLSTINSVTFRVTFSRFTLVPTIEISVSLMASCYEVHPLRSRRLVSHKGSSWRSTPVTNFDGYTSSFSVSSRGAHGVR